MASSKQYKDYILEQIKDLQNITCRPMMNEFLLYFNGVLFGGIYDNRLLIKKTQSNKHFNLNEQIPYKGAKPMYFVENLDDTEYLKQLVEITCEDL